MAAITVARGTSYSGSGGVRVAAGDNDTITLLGGGDSVTAHDHDIITIDGGGNTVRLHDNCSLTINDSRSEADGFAGTANFGDTISVHDNNAISLNYTLTLGDSDLVAVGFQPNITEGGSLPTSLLGPGQSGNKVDTAYVINAGTADTISLSGSGQTVSLSLGKGDKIGTSGSNDTITIGGAAGTKSSLTVGATASGTTINGGLGTDTFSAGSGYDGGNHFIGSAHGYQDGFTGIGSCINYAGLACRVAVDFNNNIGQGFDANGLLLWTDTYSNIQQAKAARLDGNVLTGSDSYYCELKGSLGATTYYGAAAGDRVVWSSAGATGLLDAQSTDTAYAGSGNDEFYWRNSPGGKGVSNFGEAIYGFNTAQNDALNLSEFVDSGFAGVTNPFNGTPSSLFTFVDVSLSADGRDTDIWFDRTGSGSFTQLTAVLKSENLFTAFGVTDTSNLGAQQVVQGMYDAGHLVLNQPH